MVGNRVPNQRMRKVAALLWCGLSLALLCSQLVAMAASQTVVRYADFSSGSWQESMKRIFADFEKANPDIKIEYTPIPWVNATDYLEKITVMVAGGSAPDVVQANYSILPQMADKGFLMPVDQLITRDNKEVNRADFVPVAVEATSWKGKTYGLPYDLSQWWVNYNVDAFANAGLATPSQLYERNAWTWQAMEESARKITKRSADGKTQVWGLFTFPGDAGIYPWLWAYGGDLLSKDGTRSRLGDPESIAGIERMQQLMYEERVMNFPAWTGIPIGVDYDSVVTPGAFGMELWWSTIISNYRSANVQWKYDHVPIPAGPKDANTNPATIHTISIMQGSRNTEAAWRVVKYVTGTGYKRIVQELSWGALRRSLLPTWAEVMAQQGVTGLKFFDDGISRTRLLPRGAFMPQVDSLLNSGMYPIWTNSAAPQGVMQQLSQRINALLGSN